MSDDPAADEVVPVDATPADIVAGEAVHEPASPTLAAVSPGAAGLALPLDTGYTAAGVPTFDSVREKIETRYGTAIGASELASETPLGRSVEEQYEERQRAAAERLEQIKKAMHADKPDQS